jgi:geranylgeranyl diphosphate synthase type II
LTQVTLPASFSTYRQRIDDELEHVLPAAEEDPAAIHAAMRYTTLAPSKRVRAVLALLCAELCGSAADALPVGVAIELVHAGSLILDDLPAMDDAPLRRGLPANHVKFGEAVAILAAFGLLNLAFGLIARRYEGALAATLTSLLAEAVGSDGLIAGQAEDLAATDDCIGFETLERIHRRKTGALFGAAATGGAIVGGGEPEQVRALAAYAKNLGLAFQIVDDLLDVTGDPAETGKAVRADARKTTFLSFSGIDGARQLAVELCRTADQALAPFGRRADPLRQLSAFVAARRG